MFSEFLKLSTLAVLAVSCFGCGSAGTPVPFNDNSQDTDAYALSVKQSVMDQIAAAKTSSEPGDSISALVNLLEVPGNRPPGPHEPIYLEILAAAQKVTAECAAAPNGKPKTLAQSLKDLTAIADKLPGTVEDPGRMKE